MTLGGCDGVIKSNFGIRDGWYGGSFEGGDRMEHGVKGTEAWQVHDCVLGFDMHYGALSVDASG